MPKWNPVKSLARGKPEKGAKKVKPQKNRPHVPNPNAKNILTDGSQLPSQNDW